MCRTSQRLLWTALLGVLCVLSPLEAQRTDVLILENGDRITGEVKGLSLGTLTYKTDDAGTMSVKWLHVASLQSLDIYEVKLTSGDLYYGSLGAGDQPLVLMVGEQALSLSAVVGITPIEAGFWARTSGYVDVGLSVEKANSRYGVDLDGETKYRSRKWGASSALQFHQQEQDDADRLRRASVGVDGFLYFTPVFGARGAPLWAGRAYWQASTNDELSLDLRNMIGVGAQRRLWSTNLTDASATLGLVETREKYADEEDANHSLEVLVDGDVAVFRLESPKLDLSAGPTFFVGLTEWGRIRGTLSSRVKYELLKDFYLSLNFDASFDTRPPSQTAENSDYSVSFTVGWSWS